MKTRILPVLLTSTLLVISNTGLSKSNKGNNHPNSSEASSDRGGAGNSRRGGRDKTSYEVYYGDYSSNRVFVINARNMRLKRIIEGTGLGPYETDYISTRTAYVINRDEMTLDVINTRREMITDTIPLNFKPRSIVKNPSETLGLLSGKSEPWSSLVNLQTNTIQMDGFKDSSYQAITDFGGGNATGHPYWITDTQFLMLDRTENAIELYSSNNVTPQAKLSTSSSVHHVFKVDDIYYAVLEGKRLGSSSPAVSPGMIKFTINTETNSMNLIEEKLLDSYANLPESFTSAMWGTHHAALHPNGKHIYLGSYEGTMFVIDKDTFELVDTFTAGLGLGHITFIPERNIAITTNHYATYKTVVDVSDPTNNIFIKNLEVAKPDANNTGKRMQSHTSHTDPEGNYYYSVSSLDGVFYSVNLDTLEIEGRVEMENAYPLMGAFIIDEKGGRRSGGHHRRRRHNHL